MGKAGGRAFGTRQNRPPISGQSSRRGRARGHRTKSFLANKRGQAGHIDGPIDPLGFFGLAQAAFTGKVITNATASSSHALSALLVGTRRSGDDQILRLIEPRKLPLAPTMKAAIRACQSELRSQSKLRSNAAKRPTETRTKARHVLTIASACPTCTPPSLLLPFGQRSLRPIATSVLATGDGSFTSIRAIPYLATNRSTSTRDVEYRAQSAAAFGSAQIVWSLSPGSQRERCE